MKLGLNYLRRKQKLQSQLTKLNKYIKCWMLKSTSFNSSSGKVRK